MKKQFIEFLLLIRKTIKPITFLIATSSLGLASVDYKYCNRFIQEQSLFSIAMPDGKLTQFTDRSDATIWRGTNNYGPTVKIEIKYRNPPRSVSRDDSNKELDAALARQVDLGTATAASSNVSDNTSTQTSNTRVLRAYQISPTLYRLSTTGSGDTQSKTFDMEVRNGACFPLKGKTTEQTLFDTDVCRELDNTLSHQPKSVSCQCGTKDINEKLTSILKKWGQFENPKFEFESSLINPNVADPLSRGRLTRIEKSFDGLADSPIFRAQGLLDQCARYTGVVEGASDPRFIAPTASSSGGSK